MSASAIPGGAAGASDGQSAELLLVEDDEAIADLVRELLLHDRSFPSFTVTHVERFDQALERVRAGDADPQCLVCGGILKSATISFGQQLDPDVIDRAARVCSATPLLIVIGSTLGVYPAAGLVPLAVRNGATLVIVNNQPTDYDDIADVVLREPIGEVVPGFVTTSG